MITSVDSISPYNFYRSISDLRSPSEFNIRFFEVVAPEKYAYISKLSNKDLSIDSVRITDPVYVERDPMNRGSVLYILRKGLLFKSIDPVWFDSDPPHKAPAYGVGDVVYVSLKNGVLKQRVGPYCGGGQYRMINTKLPSIFGYSTLDKVVCLASDAEAEIF